MKKASQTIPRQNWYIWSLQYCQ